MINLQTPKVIAELWKDHYSKTPHKTAFAIPGKTVIDWEAKSIRWPNMVIPLQRGQSSIENYFIQHSSTPDNFLIGVVSLEDYQKYGSGCQPAITIQVFRDLIESKNLGLILLDFKSTFVNREQSEIICKSIVSLYASATSWPQQFNETPGQFNYNSFLEFFNNSIKSI